MKLVKTPTLNCVTRPGNKYRCSGMVASGAGIPGAVALVPHQFGTVQNIEIDKPVIVDISGEAISFHRNDMKDLTCTVARSLDICTLSCK